MYADYYDMIMSMIMIASCGNIEFRYRAAVSDDLHVALHQELQAHKQSLVGNALFGPEIQSLMVDGYFTFNESTPSQTGIHTFTHIH